MDAIAEYIDETDSTAVEDSGFRQYYYHLLGVIALTEDDAARAVELFEKALTYTLRTDDPFFRTFLGEAYLAEGDARKAAVELERALQVNPNHPEALLYLGRAYLASGRRRQAREVLARLSDLWKDADADYVLNAELKKLLRTAEGRG